MVLRFPSTATCLTLLLTATHATAAPRPNSQFQTYPGFIDRSATIEAVHDQGLTLEMIVRCETGVGIIRAIKHENLYCDAQHRCTTDLKHAIQSLCE